MPEMSGRVLVVVARTTPSANVPVGVNSSKDSGAVVSTVSFNCGRAGAEVLPLASVWVKGRTKLPSGTRGLPSVQLQWPVGLTVTVLEQGAAGELIVAPGSPVPVMVGVESFVSASIDVGEVLSMGEVTEEPAAYCRG